jgi:hypothetical protein
MTSTEQRAPGVMRQARERRARDERERQLRRAIATDRRLTRRRDGAHKPTDRQPDPRYAYLTQPHD